MVMIEQWHLGVFDIEWPPSNPARFIFLKHSISVSTNRQQATPPPNSVAQAMIFHGQRTGPMPN